MGANNAKAAVSEDPLSPEEREKLKATFQRAAGNSSAAPKDKLEVKWIVGHKLCFSFEKMSRVFGKAVCHHCSLS